MTLPAKPCPFCSSDELVARPLINKKWRVHCRACRASGPYAETADMAVANWNGATDLDDHHKLKIIEQTKIQMQVKRKIWKAIRGLRLFTLEDIQRMTDAPYDSARKYVKLLEQTERVRLEKRKSNGAHVYRLISDETKTPGWVSMQHERKEVYAESQYATVQSQLRPVELEVSYEK